MELSFDRENTDFPHRIFRLFDSLSLFQSLSEIEIGASSEQEITRYALTALVRYQRIENCSVFKLHGDRLLCLSGCNIQESHGQGVCGSADCAEPGSMEFSLDEGIMGVALKSGKLQYCADCTKHGAFKEHQTNLEQKPGSLICVPILMGAEILGVLNVSHPQPNFFEPWQLQTFSLFGHTLGQLLHNHHLINRLEHQVEQRTRDLRMALEESEMLKRRYQQLSTEDELTGLHNRRYFFAEAEAMVSRAMRYGYSCSMMLLDVDYFKLINDRWGHAIGDQVLCMIADGLKQEARGGDLVARVGGEEFVIILPDSGLEGTDLMAQRIHERLGRLDLGGNIGEVGVTVSIGISYLTQEETKETTPAIMLDRLYSEADKAMYECKSEGRNRRKVFHASGN